MPNFKAKMHQIQFRLGSAPDPAGRAYSAPPDPYIAGFKRPTSKGREGVGRGKGEGRSPNIFPSRRLWCDTFTVVFQAYVFAVQVVLNTYLWLTWDI